MGNCIGNSKRIKTSDSCNVELVESQPKFKYFNVFTNNNNYVDLCKLKIGTYIVSITSTNNSNTSIFAIEITHCATIQNIVVYDESFKIKCTEYTLQFKQLHFNDSIYTISINKMSSAFS